MSNTATFWDRHAAGYAKRPVADQESYEYKLDVTRRYLSDTSRVLELGCGTGSTAIAHSPYAGEIVATDISGNMIDIARRKAADASVSNVEFRQARVDEIVEPDYDMVMAHSLLHLLDDRDIALRQIYRMLRPGGVFVSSTMCLGDAYRWVGWIARPARALGFFPLLRIFTGDQLRDSIRKAGFTFEYDWQPSPKKGLFLVARRPE